MKRILNNSFGQPYLTIRYEKEDNWIYNEWRGVLSIDSVIQGATVGLEIMRATACPYLLNNNLGVVGSWNQANDWIAREWMPQALELGLRRFAHVMGPGTFVQVSAEEMQKRAADHFAMELFSNVEEARAWLRKAQLMAV